MPATPASRQLPEGVSLPVLPGSGADRDAGAPRSAPAGNRDERLDRRQWERWENEGGALFVPPDERSAAGPAGGSR